ncbi:MAG: repair protein RecO [Variibacter sp.]|nr:repair protein RecO [Variibacter sp.]
MEWTDEGIVTGVRRHGEASAIVDVLTIDHGRHLGMVRGAASSRLRPVLQLGNTVRVVWRARLHEHLGQYVVEGLHLRAAGLLDTPHAMFGLNHLCEVVRLLPERDPHPAVHDGLNAVLERLADPGIAAASVARFELQMLTELGFGLELNACAATGGRDDLAYVSPKSGRAVSRVAGAPWQERLFRLPAFLADDAVEMSAQDFVDAFAMTGFFLARHVLEPRGQMLSDARSHFAAAISRALQRSAA